MVLTSYEAEERLARAARRCDTSLSLDYAPLTSKIRYYKDERFSDFTIACEGREFKVHRCFIAAHSKFFDKACSGMFTESQQRRIDLKEDDPSMVELMVRFFYTFDYDYPLARADVSALALHIRVYIIADRYEVLHLKSVAFKNFRSDLFARCKVGETMAQATRL
jgi:hypothetical protein